MAGIYIHIPFCKTKCHYCDFYKSTDFGAKADFLTALKKEIVLRKNEIGKETIETVYFGGGTPSVMKVSEIDDILQLIFENYKVQAESEITIEANPDDLTSAFFRSLVTTKVNRLSIGIQSFNDRDLKAMNRRHNAKQALESVNMAEHAGFNNISIDLIYGLPNQSLQDWEENIRIATGLDVDHISAYNLTYHKGTVFYDYLKAGKIKELSDELNFNQFNLLIHKLKEAGYEHYEISNFAKKGRYSRHNRSYWQRKNYLGFGPAAHSFDQRTRRWNVSSLKKYLEAIENDSVFWENEILRPQDQYNDYMITSLRTIWGISDYELDSAFGHYFADFFRKGAQPFLNTGQMLFRDGNYTLSEEGLFISDGIMEKLLFVSEF